jgi:hypothetical protein
VPTSAYSPRRARSAKFCAEAGVRVLPAPKSRAQSRWQVIRGSGVLRWRVACSMHQPGGEAGALKKTKTERPSAERRATQPQPRTPVHVSCVIYTLHIHTTYSPARTFFAENPQAPPLRGAAELVRFGFGAGGMQYVSSPALEKAVKVANGLLLKPLLLTRGTGYRNARSGNTGP